MIDTTEIELGLRFLREGKSKRIYVKDENTLVLEFKDFVTAFDGARKDDVLGKGVVNAKISAYLFKKLDELGIKTHFIEYDGCRRITVRKLNMVPLEVIARNYAYGSLLKRMPIFKPLTKLEPPIVEFHYKDDMLHDPLVLREDVVRAGLLTDSEVEEIIKLSLRINEFLTKLFESKELKFIDVKFEFGRDRKGEFILADEITGDSFRVVDSEGRHLDKEVYRRGATPQELISRYLELLSKLGIEVCEDDLRC